MPDSEQREKGRFLTDAQRELLNGNDESLNPTNKRVKRSNIRDRTIGALCDLGFVCRAWGGSDGERDRKQIYEYCHPKENELDEQIEMPDGQRIRHPETDEAPIGVWGNMGISNEMKSIVGFWHLMFREQGVFEINSVPNQLENALEISEGRYRNPDLDDSERRKMVQVEIEIKTVQDVTIERARRRLENGGDLKAIEMKALVESGVANLELNE